MVLKLNILKLFMALFSFHVFNMALHKSKEIFTVTAVAEFINIRHFTSFFLKNATCYRIIVAAFGIGDLNSVWGTEYYAGRKISLNLLSSVITGNMFYILIY